MFFLANKWLTRMHSIRMLTGRGSSRPQGWVCLSACWDTQPPPGCGPGDPPGVGLETPLDVGWRPPRCGPGDPPRPLNFPLGCGPGDPPQTCKACWDTTYKACWDTTPPPSGTVNSNTVNSKFHLIRSFFEILAGILSFHV